MTGNTVDMVAELRRRLQETERLVEHLKAELSSADRTIEDQSATIAALQMSRRDLG
ncbi:hypothetical protein [Aurantimonas sp. VKM B-3413]|uniref:hypothetical protein n=1 Tax=Aurantimonas sp. VKM B-3413 TaxID=2779401 RepID=UPI001E631758|nr:hypothetical protein [Aurantimonas sp. VKM B-3413]MCB8835933.1 hypothetical protein [Aurantimonas sp. VKM B-3413]